MKAIELLNWLKVNLDEEELNSYNISILDDDLNLLGECTHIMKNELISDIHIICK